MKLDERILNELECEQTGLPPRTGSIDSVIARGRRRKAIANGLGALTAAAVVVAVIGVSAWVTRPGGGSADVAGEQPETWTTYAAADGLTGSCACDFAVAADGTLWAVARDGAFWFDGSSWVKEPPPPGFGFGYGVAVASAPDGSMWFAGGEEHGAAHFEDGSWTVIEPFDIDMWGGLIDVAVTSDGTVWSSEGEVLTRFEGDSFEQVDEDFQLIPGHEWSEDRPSIIMSMAVAPDGTLWVAGGPLGNVDGRLYHVAGTDVTVITEVAGQGPGRLLGVAPDGAVWLSGDFYGTADGDVSFLLRFDGERWTSHDLGGVVDAAFEGDGTAWFIVDDVPIEDEWWRYQYAEPGAYRFDGETWTHLTVDDGLAGLDLTAVITASDGSIWFGTAGNGVTRYQPGTDPQSGAAIDSLGGGDPFSDDDWPDNMAATEPPPVTQAP
ncbi:hypothetical protein ACFLRH_00910 [Actinomycetota bacterium]